MGARHPDPRGGGPGRMNIPTSRRQNVAPGPLSVVTWKEYR
ncbi:hypothetical protein SLNHY_4614 [Streptomyces albus]|nr:hypothetical protein SLNHY_4614 [Streptomyces albus]